MRRLILQEPYSQAALNSGRLAAFAAALAVVDVLLARGGLDPVAAFAILGFAIVVACAALLSAATAIVVIWTTGRRGVPALIGGGLLASAVLAYPAFLAVQAVRLPKLADVTTDTEDPPDFARTRRAVDARHGIIPADVDATTRDTQEEAYPDLEPITLDLEADEAYGAVLKVLAARRWQIIEQSPPGGRRAGIGHIDAIVRSPVFRLPSDLTIRLRPLPGQTRIDIRTATRFGAHDFGEGARRIAELTDALQDATDTK
jgi:uncharacterized protein (DUF1499 family)